MNMQPNILSKSLVICYSTPNYEKLTEIFKSSLVSLGGNINHKLDIPHDHLKSGFQTDLWYYCVLSKTQHLIETLNHCKNMYDYYIASDCDIWFLKNKNNEWNQLELYLIETDSDIYFMYEDTSMDLNCGFFIIKNKNIGKIIEFFIEVYNIMLRTPNNEMPLGGQTIVNSLKDKINYGYIPNDYVIFGKTIHNKNKALLHHAAWCKTIDEKITQIAEIKQLLESKKPHICLKKSIISNIR